LQVEELESRDLLSAGSGAASLQALANPEHFANHRARHGHAAPRFEIGTTVTPTTTGPQAEEEIAISPVNPNYLIATISDISSGANVTKYAVSTNNGASWTDGFVPLSGGKPATSDNQTWNSNSDPVVAIDKLGNAYLASLYFDQGFLGNVTANGVYVSVGTVTSSGVTFTTANTKPVLTNLNSNTTLNEDKDWIAVDNSNSAFSGDVYVSWTHFTNSQADDWIYFSRSTDHGQTWSAPVKISTAAQDNHVEGSQVAVGPDGSIYVAYEAATYDSTNVHALTGQIFVSKSTNGGVTFSTPVLATPTTPFNDLDGNGFTSPYRKNSFPSLAVGPEGNVYVVYADQSQPSGGGNAEIRLVKSTNGGTSFGSPVLLNDQTAGQRLMPSVAVDQATGWVWVSWFDTRLNPSNNDLYDIYATMSTNGGATFSAQNIRVTQTTDDSGTNIIGSTFLGDYGGIAAAGGYAHPVWTKGSTDGSPANGALQTATLSGLSLPSTGNLPFTLGVGSSYGKAVVTDSSGNVYVTGSFQGTVNFNPNGTTNLTSQGGSDIFVARYSSAGALAWAVDLGGAGYDVGQAISVDSSGNVYVTGDFEGSATFGAAGTLTSPGSDDAFVAKLNATNGTVLWAKNVGGPGSSSFGLGVKVDSSGNVYTTGSFTGSANFNPNGSFVLSSAGSADAFVWKLNSSGTFVWAVGLGGSGYDTGYGIALDSSGNPYVVGSFSNTAKFGAVVQLSSAGSSDIFVAALSASTGSVTWADQMGGSGYDEGYAIALDSSNNVFIAGYFNNTATFGSFSLSSAGGDDAFVAKVNSSGTVLWVRGLGGTGLDDAYALAVDASGNVYVTGTFYHQLALEIPGTTSPFTLNGTTTANAYDMFFARFNANGDLAWARDMGGSDAWNPAFGLAWDSTSGSYYLTGQFSGTVNFDPGTSTKTLTSPAGASLFLSKIVIG
jgi:hypothetical protein